jgi:hypothetical protein
MPEEDENSRYFLIKNRHPIFWMLASGLLVEKMAKY